MATDYSPSSSGDEQQQPTGANPSMFRPKGLTPEESALLRKLRNEATWQRGYPYALIMGGLTLYATRKRSTQVKVVATAVAAIAGNVAGKLSYIPTITKRILTDLPESSPLRRQLEESRNLAGLVTQKPGDATAEDHNMQFDTGSNYDLKTFDSETQTQAAPPKKYITYEELRQKHRGEENKSLIHGYTGIKDLDERRIPKYPPGGPQGMSSGNLPHEITSGNPPQELPSNNPPDEFMPDKKVRYNKYGDPVVE